MVDAAKDDARGRRHWFIHLYSSTMLLPPTPGHPDEPPRPLILLWCWHIQPYWMIVEKKYHAHVWQGSTSYWMMFKKYQPHVLGRTPAALLTSKNSWDSWMFLPLNSCSLFLLIHSHTKTINTPLPSEISKKKNNVLLRSAVARWIYMDLSVQQKNCNLFYILLLCTTVDIKWQSFTLCLPPASQDMACLF